MAVWEKVGTTKFPSDTFCEGLFDGNRMIAKVTPCGLKYYLKDQTQSLVHIEIWESTFKDMGYCKDMKSAKNLVNGFFGILVNE